MFVPHLSSGCFAIYRISTDSRWPKEIRKQQLIRVRADCGSLQQNRRYELYSIACSVRSLSHQHLDPPFNSRSLSSDSVNITEFILTPSFKHCLLKELQGIEVWFHKSCDFHLAISVNGLCCPKHKFGGSCAELRLV